jgi:hypothetical protein
MSARTVIEARITLDEDVDQTEAEVELDLKGVTFTGRGRARRNPADPSQPVVGEELATARALSDLVHKLVDAAAETISEREGRPANLRV